MTIHTNRDLLARKVFGTDDPAELSARLSSRPHPADKLDQLSQREAAVLRLRLGLFHNALRGMDLDETASVFGITRERCRQIEAKALSRLRHPNYATASCGRCHGTGRVFPPGSPT